MSSVEQKIREVLENVAIEYGEYPSPKTINVDQATQSILQIIESDVIGENNHILVDDLLSGDLEKDTVWKVQGANELRHQQRANLREDK